MPPIVFCHYGDTPYLRYTLRCARRTNPDRPFILLGDAANEPIARAAGAEHRFLDSLPVDSLQQDFRRHYKLIQGRRHNHQKGGRDWVRFVFERWFHTYQFVREQAPDGFWHFDSDTLILEPLAPHEADLRRYACTEQCKGRCLNGFVGSAEVVRGYLESIVEQFKDADYLAAQQAEFETQNPAFAFTEMRAYDRYRNDAGLNTVHLGRPRVGPGDEPVCFDDAVCHEDGFELEPLLGGGWYGEKPIKRVELAEGGRFLGRLSGPSGEMAAGTSVRFPTLNFSWMPLGAYATALRHVERGDTAPAAGADVATLGSVPPPAAFRWQSRATGWKRQPAQVVKRLASAVAAKLNRTRANVV